MTISKISTGGFMIAISIILSRVLGIFRETLIADISGAGIQKTAYELAFTLPDILNHFVSTGFLSLSFIPLFTELKNKDSLEADRFFCNILNSFSIFIFSISILFWIFMTPLLSWFIPQNLHTELLNLTTHYSRIILPAQLFFFTGAIFTAIQHYYLKFLIPCLLGLVYNLSIIFGGLITGTIEGFVWGVLIGSLIGGCFLQGWAVFKFLRTPYFLILNPFNTYFKKYFLLSIPLILGIGPFFSLELIYRYYGNFLGSSSVSHLSYAYRIMMICVSVTAFATGVASFPYISKIYQQNKLKQLHLHFIQTLLKVYGNLTPIGIIIWFYTPFIIKTILERGQFTSNDTQIVANLLQCFLFSIFGLGGYVILIRYFYGCKKMWLPTLSSIIVTFLFLPFYPIGIERWGLNGIPIISSIMVFVLFIVLLLLWYFIFPYSSWKILVQNIIKWFSLSSIMILLSFIFHHFIIKTQENLTLLTLICCILECFFLYFFYSYLCKLLNLPHVLNFKKS